MTHSLNEVEAMGKKAARGSGLSWGLSEEAGHCLRWLCSYDFPGAAALADLLEANDGRPMADVSPISLADECWRAPTQRLSPLIAGACLSDCAERLRATGTIKMDHVSQPLLIVPFISTVAAHLKMPVKVQWDGAAFVSDGFRLNVAAEPDALSALGADRISVSTPADLGPTRTPASRATVSATDWQRLNAFAHCTYAPATEESRRLGAGTGQSDND